MYYPRRILVPTVDKWSNCSTPKMYLSHQCHLHETPFSYSRQPNVDIRDFIIRSRIARCRSRFVAPAIFVDGKVCSTDEHGSRTSPSFHLLVHLSIIDRRFMGRGLFSVRCRPSPRYIESNNESAASGSARQWGTGYRRSTGQRYCWRCCSSLIQCRSATAAEYL